MLENASYSDVIGAASMPYLNSLAQKYALTTNYYANTHPSIGNYFMLTTGDPYEPRLVQRTASTELDNVVRELTAAGKTWKSYAESLPSVGYLGSDQLLLHRHNPMSYFSDVRIVGRNRRTWFRLHSFQSTLRPEICRTIRLWLRMYMTTRTVARQG